MKIIKILSLLILTIALASCDNLTSGKRFNKDYIVLSGTIFANETITLENPIFIGSTVDVNSGNITDFLYHDAIVYIKDTETNQKQYLSFGFNQTDKGYNIGYFDPTNSFLIESGKTYRLTAFVGADSIWAETTVPDDFTVLENQGYTDDANAQYPSMAHKDIDDLYSLEISVSKLEETRINVEYFCLEDWRNAYFVLNDFMGDKPEKETDYENTMNGFPRRNVDFYTYFPRHINDEFLIKIPFNQVNYIFYGKHRVTVQVIDENSYKYKYKSQGYFNGGVKNGIGYFGSAARKILYTNVTK